MPVVILVDCENREVRAGGSVLRLHLHNQKTEEIRCFRVHVLSVVLHKEDISVRPPGDIIILVGIPCLRANCLFCTVTAFFF